LPAMIDIASVRVLLRRHARTFLTTFACILIAVACSLSLVYSAFQSIVLDSVARQYSDFVGQLDALSDILSTTIRNYGMQVFYAPSVLALREDAALDKMGQVYALRELGSYISSNDFVDSIQVYNRSSGYIYSTDSNVISAPVDSYADRDAARLFQSLTPDIRMRPIRRTAFSEDPVRVRSYFSFLFFETTAEDEPTGGALMLNVDYDRYLELLLSFNQMGDCVLLDEKGALLTAGREELLPTIPLFFDEIVETGKEDSGYILKNIEDEQTVCLHFRLASSRWYYLKIIPLQDCVPRLLELKNALIAGILIGFAVLAVCSLGVLLFLYFPVYQVRAALRTVGIEKRGELAGQVSQLAQQSEAHRKASALQSILEGKDSGLLPEELPPPYLLVLMETEHAAPVFRQTHPDCSALTCHQDGCEVVLFSGEERTDVLRICRELADLSGVCCFCGSDRDSFAQVAECHRILCEMRRQKFWTAEQRCYLEEEFAPRRPHSSFTEQMSADLIASLRGNDLEHIQSLWKHIQDSIREDRFQDQMFVFRRIASLLEKQLPALKPLVSNDFWAQLRDIRDLDARFTGAFQQIVQNNQELHKAHIDHLALLVSQRIEQAYTDSDLSPTRIADELGMSGAYLGRIFRESTQTSISQYLNQVRISHAETLLNSDRAVETIAGEVGFSNPKYFYVVFKNLTGQTPLQFRKSRAAPDGD
jgi:AraC-like DNA-binding protein